MALAPIAYVLYRGPEAQPARTPHWPDRDRFVLSAGHASMLLYASLHLTGYDLTLDDLKQFRQWESRTPGHPEALHDARRRGDDGAARPGLRQRRGHGDRGALPGRALQPAAARARRPLGPMRSARDGDLMEGISSEAASLAGHLGLGKLVYLYDDNHITIDGPTASAFTTEDVGARYEAYGWHVQHVDDADGRGRHRRRAPGAGAKRRSGPRSSSYARHRLRRPTQQAPPRRTAARSATTRSRHEEASRLGSRAHVPRARRSARAHGRRRRARRRARARVGRALRTRGRRPSPSLREDWDADHRGSAARPAGSTHSRGSRPARRSPRATPAARSSTRSGRTRRR